MTDEYLAEWLEDLERMDPARRDSTDAARCALLIAEVRRLRAEVARLTPPVLCSFCHRPAGVRYTGPRGGYVTYLCGACPAKPWDVPVPVKP